MIPASVLPADRSADTPADVPDPHRRAFPSHQHVRSPELEAQLDRLVRAREKGDAAAILVAERDLIEQFLPYAASLARRFPGRVADTDDLVQIARIGLMKAVRGWRPQPAGGFLQYATPTIIGELRRYLRDQVPLIRLPRRLYEIGAAIAMARRDLAALGGTPTDEDIAAASGLTLDEVRADALARGSTDIVPLSAASETGLCSAPEDELSAVEVRMMLAAAISSLTDRERLLLALRYFQDLTQEQIGVVLGVSQMQVSRLLRRVLATLRERLVA